LRYLYRALEAEVLKLKRTPSLLIAVAAPAVVCLVYAMMMLTQGRDAVRPDPWRSLIGNTGSLWVLLMLPLVVVTVTALWASFEHGDALWKHLFALPVPRPAVYVAKWLLSLAVVTASTLFLAVCEAIMGMVMGLFLPQLHLTWPPPFAYMLGHAAALSAASVFMVTIHMWVGLRFKGLYVALGLGVACLIGSLFASFSDTLNRILPWTLPLRVHAVVGANVPATLLYSLAGGLVVGAAALLDLVRQDHC
jgi:lantibiotic transport system permease protein